MKYKKILLVTPNCAWIKGDSRTMWGYIPYNLCMIASSLKGLYEVSIIDANFYNLGIDEFLKRINDHSPDAVGVSILTDEYAEAGFLSVRLIKELNKDITVFIGGVYPTTRHEEIDDNNVDYIFSGEGELAFREVLDMLNDKVQTLTSAVISANQYGIPVVRGGIIENLDGLPMPSYGLIKFQDYANTFVRESVDGPPEYPYGTIITSRGCPVGCVFCQVELINGKKFRARTPENVAQEIELLINSYGIRSLLFYDDNLFLNKKRANEIFTLMIERKYNLKWKASATAAYAVDREILEIARQSGLQHVGLAIESGTERVLKEVIHKPVNLGHAVEIARICRELGIATTANFVIGFPGERWDEIRQTLRYAEDLGVDYVKVFIANPLPKTKLYNIAKEGGYLASENAEGWWAMGRINTDEFSSVQLAILRAYEWDRINFKSPEKKKTIAGLMGITLEKLEEIRKDTFEKTTAILKEYLTRK